MKVKIKGDSFNTNYNSLYLNFKEENHNIIIELDGKGSWRKIEVDKEELIKTKPILKEREIEIEVEIKKDNKLEANNSLKLKGFEDIVKLKFPTEKQRTRNIEINLSKLIAILNYFKKLKNEVKE